MKDFPYFYLLPNFETRKSRQLVRHVIILNMSCLAQNDLLLFNTNGVVVVYN